MIKIISQMPKLAHCSFGAIQWSLIKFTRVAAISFGDLQTLRDSQGNLCGILNCTRNIVQTAKYIQYLDIRLGYYILNDSLCCSQGKPFRYSDPLKLYIYII